jgi:RNA polymerase sigma factor (sigma-70 family)
VARLSQHRVLARLWECDAFTIEQAAVALSPDEVAQLYRDHAPALLGFLGRRVLLAEVAVDLMAETFARAYRDRESFRGEGAEEALAWVYGIARHVLASYARRGAVERRALRALGVQRRALTDAEYDRVEELAGLAALRDRIDGELDALETGQRDAVRLRVLEERPYDEVAHELGVSEQTARARVSRALRALRDTPTFKDLEGQPDHA